MNRSAAGPRLARQTLSSSKNETERGNQVPKISGNNSYGVSVPSKLDADAVAIPADTLPRGAASTRSMSRRVDQQYAGHEIGEAGGCKLASTDFRTLPTASPPHSVGGSTIDPARASAIAASPAPPSMVASQVSLRRLPKTDYSRAARLFTEISMPAKARHARDKTLEQLSIKYRLQRTPSWDGGTHVARRGIWLRLSSNPGSSPPPRALNDHGSLGRAGVPAVGGRCFSSAACRSQSCGCKRAEAELQNGSEKEQLCVAAPPGANEIASEATMIDGKIATDRSSRKDGAETARKEASGNASYRRQGAVAQGTRHDNDSEARGGVGKPTRRKKASKITGEDVTGPHAGAAGRKGSTTRADKMSSSTSPSIKEPRAWARDRQQAAGKAADTLAVHAVGEDTTRVRALPKQIEVASARFDTGAAETTHRSRVTEESSAPSSRELIIESSESYVSRRRSESPPLPRPAAEVAPGPSLVSASSVPAGEWNSSTSITVNDRKSWVSSKARRGSRAAGMARQRHMKRIDDWERVVSETNKGWGAYPMISGIIDSRIAMEARKQERQAQVDRVVAAGLGTNGLFDQRKHEREGQESTLQQSLFQPNADTQRDDCHPTKVEAVSRAKPAGEDVDAHRDDESSIDDEELGEDRLGLRRVKRQAERRRTLYRKLRLRARVELLHSEHRSLSSLNPLVERLASLMRQTTPNASAEATAAAARRLVLARLTTAPKAERLAAAAELKQFRLPDDLMLALGIDEMAEKKLNKIKRNTFRPELSVSVPSPRIASCRAWHPGVFGGLPVCVEGESLKPSSGWSCCGSTERESGGCERTVRRKDKWQVDGI
eukprot:GHVT01061457.1.p1 GENE.GHVT01061457.1~~GHVT01061457.1.p1  ORF type:complete len:834 (-),score=120.74 GHVT01061457.1:593-3094(-)